jgi:hypothetical protein
MKTILDMYNDGSAYFRKMSDLATQKMGWGGDVENRVMIMFRDKGTPSKQYINGGSYYWNAEGDGWFRQVEGIGKGYGLIFKNLKITSKSPLTWDGKKKYDPTGNTNIFKATFEYVPDEYTGDADWKTRYEKANIWLSVPEDFDPQQAVKHVMKDQKKWVP